ncbi:MAG: response regulator, partial [Alphaproteobacteria bacterium]|nr:response regulator [Alphaproteobacteria bacterium]
LMQVMSNLLSNAAKFSPPGSEVNISIDINGPLIRISIEDDGPGISEEFHDKIFQRFSQGDSSDSRRKGGTGLGLSISQAIIEKHGGKIGLESKPGKGSMFFFYLPLKGEQKVDLSVTSNPGSIVSLSLQINHDVAETAPDEISKPVTPSEKRILHIEDDPDLCEIMGAMIGNKLHFESASTVHFARQKIYSQLYDLIILDPGMPDGNALELLEVIKQTMNASTPVIIYSSSEIDKKIAAIVDRVLLKSKNSNEDLLLIIESLI